LFGRGSVGEWRRYFGKAQSDLIDQRVRRGFLREGNEINFGRLI